MYRGDDVMEILFQNNDQWRATLSNWVGSHLFSMKTVISEGGGDDEGSLFFLCCNASNEEVPANAFTTLAFGRRIKRAKPENDAAKRELRDLTRVTFMKYMDSFFVHHGDPSSSSGMEKTEATCDMKKFFKARIAGE